jgi:pimeloyl-ACP methyl ester carboxylesterase
MTTEAVAMQTIELSAGSVEYQDSGGDGPPLVLLHGLLMDASLWSDVVAALSPDHRCIVPTLPLGAHRKPMARDTELSLVSVASLVAELLDRLDLDNVTLIGNDTGGALVQLLVASDTHRLGRIVLVSCDAFNNFPPGLTGKTLVLAGRLPAPLFAAFMQQLRCRAIRRLPIAFGWLTKRGDAVTVRWLRQLFADKATRHDAVRILRSIAADRGLLTRAATALPRFERPALVVWATADRVMPPDHGRRLAELLPQSQLVEIAESYTLIPLDQPDLLARAIREFVSGQAVAQGCATELARERQANAGTGWGAAGPM